MYELVLRVGDFQPFDFVCRIIIHEDYRMLWYERCERLHKELKLMQNST